MANRVTDLRVHEIAIVDAPAVLDAEFLIIEDEEDVERRGQLDQDEDEDAGLRMKGKKP